MVRKKWLALTGLLALGVAAFAFNTASPRPVYVPIETLAFSPGELSVAHAFLKNDCQSCHTVGKGVALRQVSATNSVNCVACHATNKALLQMQPTAFHANITNCIPCHQEHQDPKRPTQMDHIALARIGMRELGQGESGSEREQTRARLAAWMSEHSALEKMTKHPLVTPEEATLDCASCHSKQGQGQTMHVDQMGKTCASCHSTKQWTISAFVHPSPNSKECASCHAAPPSHYMMHFNMMSKKVAKKDAKVNDCASCHQTTAWNDIKGVGWFDHM